MSSMHGDSISIGFDIKQSTHLKSQNVRTGRVLEIEPSALGLQMRRVRIRASRELVHVILLVLNTSMVKGISCAVRYLS